ncbi:MAG: 30S ribosomal protein S4, partial [Promethearchaeota archaeon]
MGDPRRLKKKYKKPKHPFQKERIMEELEFLGKYGLRNKREYWKSRSLLANWRNIARQSRSLPKEQAIEVQQALI